MKHNRVEATQCRFDEGYGQGSAGPEGARQTTDPQDITNQTNADNYVYDNIGNLKKDIAQNIATIAWTPYGKIDTLRKTDLSYISYLYDASGKRITKTYSTSGNNTRTHYVYDASGNVLAVYQYKGTSSTTATEADWLEQHLYGSSRLGTLQPHVAILSTAKLASDAYNSATDQVDQAGNRLYELTNHLGNVMATINDVAITSNRSPLTAIMGANDYYPFGMPMPGRTNVASGSLNYRYGFNGKENNNEAEGVGNQIDYGNRVYDLRIGKFLSVDPLQKKYPYYTPYQFAGNTPVQAIDMDGLEPKGYSPGLADLYKDLSVKQIPSRYDNQTMQGTIGDYSGIISATAVQYIDQKTYVVYESIHGERQWYVE